MEGIRPFFFSWLKRCAMGHCKIRWSWIQPKHSHSIHGTGVFTYFGRKKQPNLSKYTIHGWYGIVKILIFILFTVRKGAPPKGRALAILEAPPFLRQIFPHAENLPTLPLFVQVRTRWASCGPRKGLSAKVLVYTYEMATEATQTVKQIMQILL